MQWHMTTNEIKIISHYVSLQEHLQFYQELVMKQSNQQKRKQNFQPDCIHSTM